MKVANLFFALVFVCVSANGKNSTGFIDDTVIIRYCDTVASLTLVSTYTRQDVAQEMEGN